MYPKGERVSMEPMSFALKLALRYFRSKKKNAFLSLISAFSILGLAIGVATLLLVLSVMDGFEGALKSRMSKGDFHILITASPKQQSPFFDLSPNTISEIYKSHTKIFSVNPVLKTEAIIRANKKVAGVSLQGVTQAHMNATDIFLIESGEKDTSKSELWLGKELAYHLNILTDENVVLISPTAREGPLGSVPRLRKFRVSGVYKSGVLEKDMHIVYTPIAAAREFLNIPVSKINQIQVLTKDLENTPAIANEIRKTLGTSYRVRDWEELNAHLFSSLKLERIAMFLVLTMIVLVASFNLTTSLSMLITEKKKDIAILKAMGATKTQIGKIFLTQGFLIGSLGIFLGTTIGLGIAYFLANYAIIQLPDVFYDRSLPIRISTIQVVSIMLIAFLTVLMAAWFPSRKAASLLPMEAFRET